MPGRSSGRSRSLRRRAASSAESFDASSTTTFAVRDVCAPLSSPVELPPADRQGQAQEEAEEGRKKKIIYIDGGKPRDKHVTVSESPRCHQLCSHTFHNAFPPTAAIRVSGQTAIHRSMVDIDSIGRVFTQTNMSTSTAIRHHSSFRQRVTTRSLPCIRILDAAVLLMGINSACATAADGAQRLSPAKKLDTCVSRLNKGSDDDSDTAIAMLAVIPALWSWLSTASMPLCPSSRCCCCCCCCLCRQAGNCRTRPSSVRHRVARCSRFRVNLPNANPLVRIESRIMMSAVPRWTAMAICCISAVLYSCREMRQMVGSYAAARSETSRIALWWNPPWVNRIMERNCMSSAAAIAPYWSSFSFCRASPTACMLGSRQPSAMS